MNDAINLQESIYAFDSFQSAVSSNSQLRNAAENLHILLLMGYRPFGSIGRGGHTQEVARALAMYSLIPDVVIPHLERYQEQLKPYASLRAYHKNFPKGLDEEGEEITINYSHPIYGVPKRKLILSSKWFFTCK